MQFAIKQFGRIISGITLAMIVFGFASLPMRVSAMHSSMEMEECGSDCSQPVDVECLKHCLDAIDHRADEAASTRTHVEFHKIVFTSLNSLQLSSLPMNELTPPLLQHRSIFIVLKVQQRE